MAGDVSKAQLGGTFTSELARKAPSRRSCILAIALACSSCSPNHTPSLDGQFHPYPEPFVQDLTPLEGEPPYRLQDIAFSLYNFESGNAEVEAAIKREDLRVIETAASWASSA